MIFSDSHHAGLYRSLYLLFHEELGHQIYFPSDSFAAWANDYSRRPGSWLGLNPNTFNRLGGIKEPENFRYIVSKEEFLAAHWDYVIATRSESIPIFEELFRHLPCTPKKIWQVGNEGSYLPIGWDNVLSSDLITYDKAYRKHRLHYSQQLGRQYDDWKPLESKSVIACFVNCLPSMNHVVDATTGYGYEAYSTWCELKKWLPEITFKSYGINCEHGFLEEVDIPAAAQEACLVLGGKHFEGYGHSLLQAYSLGRMCVVPKGFTTHRTLQLYLRPGETCFECEWTVDALTNLIQGLTLEQLQEMSYKCWVDARAKMCWPAEAQRVKGWLDDCR